MDQIEFLILSETYCIMKNIFEKLYHFIKPEYFEDINQKIIFEEISFLCPGV
jgi:hypothetical protein